VTEVFKRFVYVVFCNYDSCEMGRSPRFPGRVFSACWRSELSHCCATASKNGFCTQRKEMVSNLQDVFTTPSLSWCSPLGQSGFTVSFFLHSSSALAIAFHREQRWWDHTADCVLSSACPPKQFQAWKLGHVTHMNNPEWNTSSTALERGTGSDTFHSWVLCSV